MSDDNEWGLSVDGEDDDGSSDSLQFQDLNEVQDNKPEDEEEELEEEEVESGDDVAEEVAAKAGEKLEEKLQDMTSIKENEEEEDILTNWARDSKKERYGVTLRRHILEGTIDEIDPSDLSENLDSVIDVELLQEARGETEKEELIEEFDNRIDDLGDRSTDHLVHSGEYRYLPVFGFNINHVCTVPYRDAGADDYEFDSIFIGDKLLSWWEGDSITPRHPYLLLNPIDSTKNTNHTADGVPYREIFRLPKGEQLSFSDSGGFQMVSREDAGRVSSADQHDWQNAVLHPETVLDWQIDNADAGPILDHPPYVTEGESSIFSAEDDNLSQWIDDPYLTFLNRTAENAESMSNHLEARKENGDMRAEDYKMFGVIQGHTFNPDAIEGSPRCLEEDDYTDDEERPHWYMLERWHEKIEDKKDDWYGWALSPTPCTSPGQIGLHLSYAHNNCEDAEWFHVLQVGSAINISVIQFYSMLSDKFVTSDASSHNRGSKYRQFMLPPGFGSSVKITDREDRFESYPCNCEVCDTVEQEHGFEYIGDGADSKRNATMNLHNLTMQVQSQKMLDAMMRAEAEELLAGLQMDSDGENIKRVYSDFWKFLMDKTTQSKVKQVYSAMAYIYCSMENGMQDRHEFWVKESQYLQPEDDPEESDYNQTRSIVDEEGMSGGARTAEDDEEEEEEEEETDLTEDEKYYLDLPAVRTDDPAEEGDKDYYYKLFVEPNIPGEEMSTSTGEDALKADW